MLNHEELKSAEGNMITLYLKLPKNHLGGVQ